MSSEKNSLLSDMPVQDSVVFHNSFKEAMGLLCDDWLNGLDRFSGTKEFGNVLAIGPEARAMTEKNQGLVVPNQFPTHLKDGTIGIDSACLVELVHDGGGVEDNHRLPEKRDLNNSTWWICMSDIVKKKRAVPTPFTTPISICQPLLFGGHVCDIL